MAYRPPRKEVTYDRIKGLAKVKVDPNSGNVGVWFRKEDGGHKFVIKAENVKTDPVLQGTLFAETSEDGTYLYSVRPHKGLFPAVCVGLVHQENKDPEPTWKTGEWGPWGFFLAKVQITEGKAKGCIYTYFLSWKFTEVLDEQGHSVVGLEGTRGKATRADELERFMLMTGAWEKPIPWSENPLPIIDKRIREARAPFMITVVDGFIDQLVDAIQEDDDEGWG